MANFIKENFSYHGGFLHYYRDGLFIRENGAEKFVARFKYCKRDKPGFQSFLIKNFTQEEYFSRLEAGETPQGILESKGYVSATSRRMQREKEEFCKRERITLEDYDRIEKESWQQCKLPREERKTFRQLVREFAGPMTIQVID
jgi:hypothetical protein